MKLLAISTSTPRGSAALFDGDHLLAQVSYTDLRGHAERLFAALDEVLGAAGIERGALQAIACDIGPGSFTGVRVGVASAKGAALALGLRAAGVMSLEAMAAAAFGEGLAQPGDVVAATIDAKKDEIFLAAFDASLARIIEPRHVERAAAAGVLLPLAGAGRRVVIVGEVADQLEPLRPHVARSTSADLPDAAWIGRVAAGRLRAADGGRDPGDPAALEPLYVRAPDAKPAAVG